MKYNIKKETYKMLARLEQARINKERADIGIVFSTNKGGISRVRMINEYDVPKDVK